MPTELQTSQQKEGGKRIGPSENRQPQFDNSAPLKYV